jgi:hypothetical protein
MSPWSTGEASPRRSAGSMQVNSTPSGAA